ncbi:hypothetical protein TNCV_2971751 [Trichonephila clavipes]|nr:hypothetical protein TNCV_2971751 [Trichonephila clavipes]
MFRGILYHSSWRYCECSGRDAGGQYRFHIRRSKIDHKGSLTLRRHLTLTSGTSSLGIVANTAESRCRLSPAVTFAAVVHFIDTSIRFNSHRSLSLISFCVHYFALQSLSCHDVCMVS